MVHLHQFPVPVEGVHYQNPAIHAIVEQTELGKGTLYVTESEMSWISSASGEGFTIQYRKMSVHAISRDENVHPSHCIYIMLNGRIDPDIEPEIVESDEDEEDPDEIITEIKFIPDEPEILPSLYNAMQECTLLHPDSASDMTDEEQEEEEEEVDYGGAGDIEEDDGEDYDDMGRTPGLGQFGAGDGCGNNGNGGQPLPGQFDDAD